MRPCHLALSLTLLLPAAALAQNVPGLGGGQAPSLSTLGNALGAGNGGGGASGVLGQALPNIGSAGKANTAGVLGYCIKNNYLNKASAGGLLSQLSGQQGVTASPAFSAGQQGQIQTGKGDFSLSGVQDQVKSKACEMVLSHARSLL